MATLFESLHLVCNSSQIDSLTFELWELGSVGIREEDLGSRIRVAATFERGRIDKESLRIRFASFSPEWEQEEDVDWIARTHSAWPPRAVGDLIFISPVWSEHPTPEGRVRLVHNPGQASGTGEHPCTQLALESLEKLVGSNTRVVDVGTGSGILAIAARLLGAKFAAGLDTDEAAILIAKENFELNRLQSALVVGSADCISNEAADIVVANISGTVLLSLADDLRRMLRSPAWLILTGFPESELSILQQTFGPGPVTAMNEWRCLTLAL